MIRRMATGLAALLVGVGAAGCGGDSKPTIPDKVIQAPGSDSQGEDGGGKGKKSKGEAATDG